MSSTSRINVSDVTTNKEKIESTLQCMQYYSLSFINEFWALVIGYGFLTTLLHKILTNYAQLKFSLAFIEQKNMEKGIENNDVRS